MDDMGDAVYNDSDVTPSGVYDDILSENTPTENTVNLKYDTNKKRGFFGIANPFQSPMSSRKSTRKVKIRQTARLAKACFVRQEGNVNVRFEENDKLVIMFKYENKHVVFREKDGAIAMLEHAIFQQRNPTAMLDASDYGGELRNMRVALGYAVINYDISSKKLQQDDVILILADSRSKIVGITLDRTLRIFPFGMVTIITEPRICIGGGMILNMVATENFQSTTTSFKTVLAGEIIQITKGSKHIFSWLADDHQQVSLHNLKETTLLQGSSLLFSRPVRNSTVEEKDEDETYEQIGEPVYHGKTFSVKQMEPLPQPNVDVDKSLDSDDSLENEHWFCGKLNREEAENILTKDGDFLVRYKTGTPWEFALSFKHNKECIHLNLSLERGKYRTNGGNFKSIRAVINAHYGQGVPVSRKDRSMILRQPVTVESIYYIDTMEEESYQELDELTESTEQLRAGCESGFEEIYEAHPESLSLIEKIDKFEKWNGETSTNPPKHQQTIHNLPSRSESSVELAEHQRHESHEIFEMVPSGECVQMVEMKKVLDNADEYEVYYNTEVDPCISQVTELQDILPFEKDQEEQTIHNLPSRGEFSIKLEEHQHHGAQKMYYMVPPEDCEQRVEIKKLPVLDIADDYEMYYDTEVDACIPNQFTELQDILPFEKNQGEVSTGEVSEKCGSKEWGKYLRRLLHIEKYVNEEGGELHIPSVNVRVFIPPRALTSGEIISVTVLDADLLSSKSSTRVSPLIVLSPDGLQFRQPVEVHIPHCGVFEGKKTPEVTVLIGNVVEDNAFTWNKLLTNYIINEKECRLSLTHFCIVDIQLGIKGKKVKAIPLASKMRMGDKFMILSCWIFNSYPGQDLTKELSNSVAVRSTVLDAFQEFVVLPSEKPIFCNLTSHNYEWNPKHTTQLIPFNRIWHAERVRSEFKVELIHATPAGSTLLDFTLEVKQPDNEELKFYLQREIQHLQLSSELLEATEHCLPLVTESDSPLIAMAQKLTKRECIRLAAFFNLPPECLDIIKCDDNSGIALLQELHKRKFITDRNFIVLINALEDVGLAIYTDQIMSSHPTTSRNVEGLVKVPDPFGKLKVQISDSLNGKYCRMIARVSGLGADFLDPSKKDESPGISLLYELERQGLFGKHNLDGLKRDLADLDFSSLVELLTTYRREHDSSVTRISLYFGRLLSLITESYY